MLIIVTEEQLGNLIKHTFRNVLFKNGIFTIQIWAIKFAEDLRMSVLQRGTGSGGAGNREGGVGRVGDGGVGSGQGGDGGVGSGQGGDGGVGSGEGGD